MPKDTTTVSEMKEAAPTGPVRAGQVFLVLARLIFGAFVVMTSFYCLLAFIPFTYQWMIRSPLVGWVTLFAKFHPYLYWISLAILSTTLIWEIRSRQIIAVVFLLFHCGLGVLLSLSPLLVRLSNDDNSAAYSLVALTPLLWIAVIDYAALHRQVNWDLYRLSKLSFLTVVLVAGFLSLVYLASFYVQFASRGIVKLGSVEILSAAGLSIAAHLVVFTLPYAAVRVIRTVAARSAAPFRLEFLLSILLIGIAMFATLRTIVLPALSFRGTVGLAYSVALAGVLSAYVGGLSLRACCSGQVRVRDGFELALAPLLALTPHRASRGVVKWLWLIVLAIVAYLFRTSVVGMDWGFVVQKLLALVVWVLAFSFFYSLMRERAVAAQSAGRPALIAVLLSILSIVLYRSVDRSGLHTDELSGDGPGIWTAAHTYSNYDISFGLARDILHGRVGMNLLPPTVQNQLRAALDSHPADGLSENAASSLYEALRENTNLSHSVVVKPVEINLVDNFGLSSGEKPHIFIFVIDSLRQDYISPYNKAVSFTPSIERFARESVVMKNAFTRYSGTVLAEPAIWTGTMQLHKQYIEPFYPMNALQKLIEAHGYDSFITMDPVLKIVMRPSSTITELDSDLRWFQYDFCVSLQELKGKLDSRPAGRPAFVYIQPQNLHTIVLTNHKPVAPGQSFPGFYEHYASQVKRVDECFGGFIDYLKDRGMYDESIIILTSDHGDSLNEDGRWGHSYWLYPEIVKIPLIVHLPSKMKRLVSDPLSIAFSTDITPTLYFLLGHKPIKRDPLFGRPLFTSTHDERAQYLRKTYLIASSYGAVYGIIGDNGRSLYIADGVNDKDHLLKLKADFGYTAEILRPDTRVEYERLIRQELLEIRRFYGLGGD